MTTREELLETLRRLAVEQGPNITLYRFREETGISRSIVYDRWGNWTNLRVAAGLPRRVTIAPVYTQDELLGEFHAAVREINGYPTAGEFSRLSDRSWNTFDRRFGLKPQLIDCRVPLAVALGRQCMLADSVQPENHWRTSTFASATRRCVATHPTKLAGATRAEDLQLILGPDLWQTSDIHHGWVVLAHIHAIHFSYCRG